MNKSGVARCYFINTSQFTSINYQHNTGIHVEAGDSSGDETAVRCDYPK